jgi:hypothetical protein
VLDSHPGWTVVASTPRADGKSIPFQIQIGYAPAPDLTGKWVAITRSVEPDGSQRKITISDPFSTRETAEQAATIAARELHEKGIPMLFAADPVSCKCLHCTIRHWRTNAHSISRLCQYVGAGIFLVSLTFSGSWSWLIRDVSMMFCWFGAGGAWASWSLSRRVLDASR